MHWLGFLAKSALIAVKKRQIKNFNFYQIDFIDVSILVFAGRFDDLKNCVDKAKAKVYFEELEGAKISVFRVNIKVDKLLQDFIISGGFDL